MNPVKRLTLFDLDHTLLPLDSDYQWADFLARNGHAGDPAQALRRNDEIMDRYNAGQLSAQESYDFMLGFLADASLDQLHQWHAAYMKAVITPAVTPIALDLVNKHLAQGDLCAIVTATNEFVAAPIAKAFNIEHLLATVPELIDNRYTGKVQGVPCYQAGKITRVQEWLNSQRLQLDDFAETWFYSDSINDVPLMERVTHPVATNPSPSLRALATERGWPILDLFQDMRDAKS